MSNAVIAVAMFGFMAFMAWLDQGGASSPNLNVCSSHKGVGQSLGVGKGAHEDLGVECVDGYSVKIHVI